MGCLCCTHDEPWNSTTTTTTTTNDNNNNTKKKKKKKKHKDNDSNSNLIDGGAAAASNFDPMTGDLVSIAYSNLDNPTAGRLCLDGWHLISIYTPRHWHARLRKVAGRDGVCCHPIQGSLCCCCGGGDLKSSTPSFALFTLMIRYMLNSSLFYFGDWRLRIQFNLFAANFKKMGSDPTALFFVMKYLFVQVLIVAQKMCSCLTQVVCIWIKQKHRHAY